MPTSELIECSKRRALKIEESREQFIENKLGVWFIEKKGRNRKKYSDALLCILHSSYAYTVYFICE